MKTRRTMNMKRTLVRSGLLSTCLMIPAGMTQFATPAFAQVSTGSINGTVTDATGAVIPNAQIVLTNKATGDKRTITSNGSGNFTFAAVQTGDYSVTITADGFQTFTENGVHLDPGDSRGLPNLKLQTGGAEQVVTVEGTSDIPLDTGERSDLITSEEIQHLSVEGRDVTELLRTLPGFAIASGSNTNPSNQAADTSQVSTNGFLGAYSANGNLASGNTLRLDGANITDPGSFAGQLQNVNYDQVAEVKTETSNFGADIANGPIVISAVTKSGSDHFHGQIYGYARTYQLNATDALAKATGQGKVPDREVYPGFTVGGPVLIPGTKFNHNRAFTFFAGAEDYAQRNVYAYGGSGAALVHALVPTAAMRGGDFSQAALQSYLGPLYGTSNFANVTQSPTFGKLDAPSSAGGTGSLVNGQVPAALQDPGAQYILNQLPLPNNTPTVANPYNWQSTDLINNDNWQAIGRVDIAISQRNHFFARYSTERGQSGEPAAIYYNPNGLNTPGGGSSKVNSESEAANLTTIVSSSLTNQIYANMVYLSDGFSSNNLSAYTSYPYQGAYANGQHLLPEIQAYNGPTSGTFRGLPLGIFPDYTHPIFTHKFDPEAGDNVTKVWGKHTAAFGVYGTRVTNNQTQQPQNGYATNGFISNYYLPGAGATLTDLPVNGKSANYTMSGNDVANFLEGFVGGYGQYNLVPQSNLYFWNVAFFATDSWKVTPRLTVNYGMRLDHLGLWNDQHGLGVAVFNPSLISSSTALSPFPGFLWHSVSPNLPLSGNNSRLAYVEPRLGFAYDLLGTGKTVLRGGWGEYRGHDSWNDISTSTSITENVSSVSYNGSSLAAISQQNVSPALTNLPNRTAISTTNTYNAVTIGDREQPLADTYSLTLNQSVPGHMIAFVGYVGDNNRFLINGGSTQPTTLANVNSIPIGGMYRPDPDTASQNYGKVLTPLGLNPANTPGNLSNVVTGANAQQQNEYRPLNTPNVQYGPIDVVNHNLWANYNGVQMGIARQTGRVLFNVNYTFSHALGVRGAGANDANGFPGDPSNPYNDYGTESFDRRHIFNATYTFEVGKPVKQRVLAQLANGWEISGITNIQSGPDIAALTAPNLGITGQIGPSNIPDVTNPTGPQVANPNAIQVSNVEYLGTPDYDLQPTVTCNPKSGLGASQFMNGNCFGTPNFLQQGRYVLPRLTGPLYFNTDLSAQKSFNFLESQSILFRVSGFNFINHGLTTLSNDFPGEYALNFTNPNSGSYVQNSSNSSLGFGSFPYKIGRRIVELEAKYTF